MSPPALSVIVVCWNAERTIEGCLSSLLANPPERRHEIWVLDNASRDRTRDRVRAFGSDVNFVELGGNRGFAGACNEGYRRSRGDYLLFLNSDVQAHPDALENLCAFLDRRPEAGAATGKLLGPDGSPQRGFNVRAFPTVASTALEILMLDKLLPGNPVTRAQRMLDFRFDQEAEVDQPAGACLLVRRTLFESVGLFDEGFYPAWFEDVDLCLRLRAHGASLFFVPGASFLHYGGASLESLAYGEFLCIWYRNLLRYFRKHRGGAAASFLRVLVAIGMVERTIASFFVAPRAGLSRTHARAAYRQVLKESL